MTHGWAALFILASIVVAIGAGVITVVTVRRRSGTRDNQAATLLAARRATRHIARDARRRGRGTLRGEGMGGNDSLASDATDAGDSP